MLQRSGTARMTLIADIVETENPQDRQAPTARKLLIGWANAQDDWARAIVAEVLSSRQQLGEAQLDAVFNSYLVEKGLAEGTHTAMPGIVFDKGSDAEAASFIIEKLEAVRGVNALAAEQTIEFNPGLTILFGENGAGKTGYARIFKQLAAVRTAQPILPNVHDSTDTASPEAIVTYRAGAESVVLTWKGEAGVAPFTHLSVFDSPALHLHVDENLTYVYTPRDLSLFPLVNTALSAIKTRLDTSIATRKSNTNSYLSFFTRGTAVYQLIETLGAATELSELDRLATVDDDAASKLEVLRDKVDALGSTVIATQLSAARSRHTLYTELSTAITTLKTFAIAAYNQAVADLARAIEEIEVLRRELSVAAGLSGNSDEIWQAFILSGDAYREHVGGDSYPTEGDHCLYCQQPLRGEAVALLRRYRDFANDSAQTRVNESHRMAATLSSGLRALHPAALSAAIANMQDPEAPDFVLEQAAALASAVAAVQDTVGVGDQVEVAALAVPDGLEAEIATRQAAAESLISELSGRAEARQKALQTAQRELSEHKDRIELNSRLVSIRAHVADAKWAQRADQLSRRLPPVAASLTNVAKVASQQLLNTDFSHQFEAECRALRAPVVGLEFPGQKGKAARRKTVPVAKHPSEVLSEGEQKVIGLADFLAEAALRLSPAPLVFDDPVTSLDYRRIKEVADRVAALAADRQVIVLTHNIWFTTELLARFEKDTVRCTYYSITDDPAKGVIIPGTHPRWDTISKTGGKIKELIASARTAKGALQEALIESAYSKIRGWCEILVETELLASVTQRYQPNVMMTKLDEIKGPHLAAAFAVITPIFNKACRVIDAHSQPLETLSTRPKFSELEQDWADLLATGEAYRAAK